jgi:hypothetical protein
MAIKSSECRGEDCLSCGPRLVWFPPAPVATACVFCTACAAWSEFEVETAPALFVRRRLSPILELTTERPDIGPGRLQRQQQLFPEGPSLGDVRVLLRSDPDSRKHLTTRTFTGNRSIVVHAYE